MSAKDWVILIVAATMVALLGIWFALSKIGGYLIHQFPASLLEQVGNVFIAVGNAALGTFLMVLFVALIVVAVILYVKEKVSHTY